MASPPSDTGTAIVMGKKGEFVITGGGDEEAIARGVFDTYLTSNLRYSQMAPLTVWDEVNTNNNLPAQIELYATDGDAYKFLFMAKGGGSANKSYLFQETKAVLKYLDTLPTTGNELGRGFRDVELERRFRIEVVDFPAFIVVDDKGDDFFAELSTPVAIANP